MRDQRRGGRFAVGAGDGDQRTWRARFRALAAEQFDVADDLDAGLARERRRPVRRRMGQRHAGRQHQRGDRRPVEVAQILRLEAGGARLGELLASSSKAMTSAPPAASARADNRPEPPRPNTATFLPAKMVMGIIRRRRVPTLPLRGGSTTKRRREWGELSALSRPPGPASPTAPPLGEVKRRARRAPENLIATSASPARPAPAPRRRSRSGSRSAARSSRAARSDGGSAPS